MHQCPKVKDSSDCFPKLTSAMPQSIPRRERFIFSGVVLVLSLCWAAHGQTSPDDLLLKDYKPRSIFNIPATRVVKARYPIIDVHSHDYAPTDADVDRWVQTMDEVGLEKTIILSGSTGSKFDAVLAKLQPPSKTIRSLVRNRLLRFRPAWVRPRGQRGTGALPSRRSQGCGGAGR